MRRAASISGVAASASVALFASCSARSIAQGCNSPPLSSEACFVGRLISTRPIFRVDSRTDQAVNGGESVHEKERTARKRKKRRMREEYPLLKHVSRLRRRPSTNFVVQRLACIWFSAGGRLTTKTDNRKISIWDAALCT